MIGSSTAAGAEVLAGLPQSAKGAVEGVGLAVTLLAQERIQTGACSPRWSALRSLAG